MPAPTPSPLVRLWTPEGFRGDDWRHAETAEALAGDGRFILPLQAYLDLDPDVRRSAGGRLGVQLAPGDPIDAIAPFLGELPLVALAFPSFSDGRSYSKAELLRSRHGFNGIVRATGQVLIDQLPHMLRLGFTEFEVSHPVWVPVNWKPWRSRWASSRRGSTIADRVSPLTLMRSPLGVTVR